MNFAQLCEVFVQSSHPGMIPVEVAPRYLYHYTATKFIPAIKKYGLIPRWSNENNTYGDSPTNFYATWFCDNIPDMIQYYKFSAFTSEPTTLLRVEPSKLKRDKLKALKGDYAGRFIYLATVPANYIASTDNPYNAVIGKTIERSPQIDPTALDREFDKNQWR